MNESLGPKGIETFEKKFRDSTPPLLVRKKATRREKREPYTTRK